MSEKGFFSRRPYAIPALLATGMLLGALGPWPYPYYKVLRWVVCAAAVFVAYEAYVWKHQWAIWLFVFVAALFNPLIPMHLNRDLWRVIDLATAIAFVGGIAALRRPVTPKKHPEESSNDRIRLP